MTLLELLDVLTITQGKGYKVYANCIATDENLVIKRGNFDISKLKPYFNNKVFQILTNDYENYLVIVLEGGPSNDNI